LLQMARQIQARIGAGVSQEKMQGVCHGGVKIKEVGASMLVVR